MPDDLSRYAVADGPNHRADPLEDARRWFDRAAKCDRLGPVRDGCIAEAEAALERAGLIVVGEIGQFGRGRRVVTARPCGMCAQVCWQCQDRYDRLKAERERQEERVTALEIAFVEAGDDERDAIAERLQDSIEAWWDMGKELDDLECPAP